MRVLAHVVGYPPKTHVGGWTATHRYLARLVDAGHTVHVITAGRNAAYTHDGVQVTHFDRLIPLLSRADVCVSNFGDDCRLHRAAQRAGKPSVRMVHGAMAASRDKLTSQGVPELTVFNTHQLQEWFAFDGPQMVCHPILVPAEYATTPGDSITLVNLLPEKGVHVLDKIARWMPDRHFLAVRGGYSQGHQYNPFRGNIEIVPHTANMRDHVYARSRIVIMPSQFESFGLVGLEAYCSGIPVIAHPTAGLTEALGNAGLWADRDTIDEWLDHIERLDDRRHYNFVARKAKARAAEVAAEDGPERFIAALEALV